MAPLKWKTEKRLVDELLPMEINPRRLTEKQAADLETSLKKFGLVEIPVINRDGKLIAGHQRVAILKILGRGAEEIDVRVPSRQLTPGEVREYNIRSNKNVGSWDYDLLANHFDVQELLNWGFTQEQLDLNLLSNVAGGEAPDLPEGGKPPFQQMTFVLHDSQAKWVKLAMEKASGEGGDVSRVNENRNGNLLAYICEAFTETEVEK